MSDKSNKGPLGDPNIKKKLEAFVSNWAPSINLAVKRLKDQGLVGADLSPEEFFSHGYDGLMKAVATYDKDHPTKANFKTFAKWFCRSTET